MKYATLHRVMAVTLVALAALAAIAGTAATAAANGPDVIVTGHAGVRVWVDGGDVFQDYDDVDFYLRADRDCYATLMLVDTDGYLHVLYPSSPYASAWLHGGRTYRYRACDLGLDRLDGVGIAHVYAVGSPVPFDYSYYGASVFVGGFGFRVYGDPYVACREFYVSLLPASCRWDFVAVSSARFYVRQWVRYPAYLCTPGYGVHVRVGDCCRQCGDVYASYRCNVANPHDALYAPPARFKQVYTPDRVARTTGRVTHARVKSSERSDEVRVARAERVKVVSTSRTREAARAAAPAPDHAKSNYNGNSDYRVKDRVTAQSATGRAKVSREASVDAKRMKSGKSATADRTAAKRQKGAAKQGRQAH